MSRDSILWLCWSLALVVPVVAQDTVPEEFHEVLKEWETVDMPPTAEEQEQWLKELESGGADRTGGRAAFWHGDLRWRGFFRNPGQGKWDGRLKLAGGPAQAKFRLGRDLVGARVLGGGLEVQTGPVRIVAGYLGQAAGSGLLLSAPGRARTLTADGHLVRSRARLAWWTGIQESRTVQGVGLESGRGSFQLQAMAGRLCFPPTGEKAAVQALTLAWNRPALRLAVSGLGAASGRGLTFWGEGGSRFLNWTGEASLWRPSSWRRSTSSWQVVVTCRPARPWLFQGGLAHGSGGPGSPLGTRSSLLKGDQGRGWALRGSWKSPGNVKLALLTAETTHETLGSQPRLYRVRSWDLIVRANPATSWLLSVRLRVSAWQRWEWSDRYPWQPPALSHLESKNLGQMRLAWQGSDRSLVLTGNILQRGDSVGSGSRILIGVAGKRRWGGAFQIRAGYGTAWGEPVDLVSAVSPLPGLVLPRHWGSWQSETYAGFRWQKRSWVAGAAVSYRRSQPESGYRDLVQVWLEMGWSWPGQGKSVN